MPCKSDMKMPLVLVLGLLCTPCFAQEVQLGFGIKGGTLRSFYEPGIEELERGVRDQLLEFCKHDPYLRYWSMVAPAEDEAERAGEPGLDVVLFLENDVLRIQLDVRSAFLSGLSQITTRFSARLVPPAEMERITMRGAPPPNRLAELVGKSFDGLLENNLTAVFSSMSQGYPLGRFGHDFEPAVTENRERFEMVLPIDTTDERNCFLRTSVFELRCESSRSTDTRLDSRGTGFVAGYPPEGVPSEARILGVIVVLEQLRIGTGAAEPLATTSHADLMRSLRPRLFFLRELNEGAHTCFGAEISIVP